MSVLPVRIDRASPVPLYHQLAEQLTAAVTDGTLSPGDAFENEVALAARLGLSRPTVRRAIAELVGRGLLVRRRGIGTTVANQAVHRRAELTSLYDDLLREGRTPSTQVLSLQTGVTDERAAVALGLDPSTPLVAMVRLRYAGDAPLAVLRNWLPASSGEFTVEQLQTDGLYALLRAIGIRPTVAHQSIGARNATAEERRLLQLRGPSPLLTMTRSAFDAEGGPVEFGDHCYRSDQYPSMPWSTSVDRVDRTLHNAICVPGHYFCRNASPASTTPGQAAVRSLARCAPGHPTVRKPMILDIMMSHQHRAADRNRTTGRGERAATGCRLSRFPRP